MFVIDRIFVSKTNFYLKIGRSGIGRKLNAMKFQV